MNQLKDNKSYILVLNYYNLEKFKQFEKVIIDDNHSDSVKDYIVLKRVHSEIENHSTKNRIIIPYGQE